MAAATVAVPLPVAQEEGRMQPLSLPFPLFFSLSVYLFRYAKRGG